MLTTTPLLPDTNVFLHYKSVADIDWPALAGGGAVTLVICLQVIKELDAKKDHPDLGDRAKRAIREIRAIRSSGGLVRDGVMLEVFNEEIRLDLLPSHMSPDSADDRIVYQAKQYSQSHGGIGVAVVTADLGLELRCSASGVGVLVPDEKNRLPNPESELTRQNRRLTNEIATLQNRVPKLSVRADGGIEGEDVFSIVLVRPAPLDVATEMNHERRTYPKIQPKSESYQTGNWLNASEVPSYEYARYNAELEKYLAAYEAHIPHRSAYLDARARSFPFELILENNGSCPAEDIDVYMHISNDVVESVTKEEDNDLQIPPLPPLPEKPSSPLSDMSRMSTLGDMNLRNLDVFRPAMKHDGVQWSRVKAETNDFVIRIKIGRLKHTFTISLGTFRARFRSWESVRPIQAGCSIVANNDPKRREHPVILRVCRKDSLQ